MTRAVIEALRERLERLRVRQRVSRAERAARLVAHGKRFAALPLSDPRSPVEIVGYDKLGLPR